MARVAKLAAIPIFSGVRNSLIAELLLGLTQAQRNWGFGLCFLYLRNVKEYTWNHKRVYRIYRELELNLRIKPRKRLKREKPEELSVPETRNTFQHSQIISCQAA